MLAVPTSSDTSAPSRCLAATPKRRARTSRRARAALAPYLADYPDLRARANALAEVSSIAHLRSGEAENCLVNPGTDRCIFPLRAGGIHHAPRGALAAFEQFQTLMRQEPDNLELRWLLIGDLLLGATVMEREKGWNLLCKFFDNMGPIPHHMHQSDAQATLLGRKGKPEAYYFPPQYNQTDNNFPYTFMGLEPGTTKADVRRCLENWNKGDNGILFLSRAFRLEPGTGWQIDPGILHAPGSLVTYEPQVASDVFAMFQSEVEGRITPWALLTKDVPPEYHDDLDYLVELLDWDANVNPKFAADNRCFPKPVRPFAETEGDGYREQWVCYGTGWYSAKELTVLPEAHGHHHGRRRLRGDPDAGLRHVRLAAGVDAVDDPLRPDDGRRALRQRAAATARASASRTSAPPIRS